MSGLRSARAEERLVLVEEGGRGGWIERRILHALGEHLDHMNLPVVEASAAAAFGRAALSGRAVSVRVEPAEVDRADVVIRAELSLDGRKTATARGPAATLDTLASRLAIGLAAALGREVSREEASRFGSVPLPFSVHRLIGRAEGRAQTGDLRRALLSLERALERAPTGSVETLIAARRIRLGMGEERPELVAAARERARDAKRRGRLEEALAATRDALRFGAKPRVRWRLDLPTGEHRFAVGEDRIWLLRGSRWLTIGARSGFLDDRGRAAGPIEGVVKGELLMRRPGRGKVSRLIRMAPDGRPRWDLRLGEKTARVEVSGAGHIAVVGTARWAWVEESVGTKTRGMGIPLAVGEVGALVEKGPGRVALVRPGRTAPTWTASVSGPIRATRLTRAKALLLTPNGLTILDAHDGALRKIEGVPTDMRLLGARGRHAALGMGTRVLLVDVLAGAVTAEVRTPSMALGAHAGAFTISVLCVDGEVLHWDPDGLLIDRARVKGNPVGILAGPPEAPGPLVETRREIVAFSEVLPDDHTDVDLLLDSAQMAHGLGQTEAARRLVGWVRRRGYGRLDRAESLEARLQSPNPE